MSEDRLTKEEIVAAWNEAVPESKDKGIEMYLHLMQAVADAQYRKCALTALSEGFREGIEAAANEVDAWDYHELAKDIRALSPRETDEGYANAHPRELDAPASAPSSEVAEMVKRLNEALPRLTDVALSAYAKHRTHLHECLPLLRDAAALLSKVGQGWVPVSERLPEPQKMILMHLPNSHRGPVSYGFLDISTRKFMTGVASISHWMACEGQDTVTHWMPLPPPPERP